jgi:hypothetical protein
MRYTFAVNKVNDLGAHEPQPDKTIEVDAPNEELARSIARVKLRDLSPGVQRFQPAELIKPPFEPKPAAAAQPVAPVAPPKPVPPTTPPPVTPPVQ